MAVGIRGTAQGNQGLTGNTATCAFALPAGSAVGDTAVFGGSQNSASATYTPPSGSVALSGTPDSTGGVLLTQVWAKDLTSTDISNGSLTVSSSVAGKFSGAAIFLTGTAAASLLIGAVDQNSTASTSQSSNTVASVPAGSMQIDLIFARAASATATGIGTTSGFSQDVLCQTASASSPNYSTAIEHKTATVSGTVGGDSFSTTLSSTANVYTVAAVSVTASAGATGSLTLGGSAAATAPASSTGTLTLGGGPGAAQARASVAGALTLGGTAAQLGPNFGGVLTLSGGPVGAQARATATGVVTLGGTVTPRANAAATTGVLTLAGSGTPRAPASAVSGAISLAGGPAQASFRFQVWTGTAWKPITPLVWDGTSWVAIKVTVTPALL